MKLAIALLCACIVVTQAFDSGLFQSKVHHRVRSNKLHASAVEPYAADDDIGKAEIEAAFARGLNSAPSKWEPLKPSIAKKFPKGVKNAKGAFAKRLDANYDNFLQKFEKFEMEANDASVNVKLDTPLKTLAYKTLDVSPADDFMETTKPMMKKARLAARNGGIKEKRELVRMEVAYKNLNKYRFKELMFGDMEDRYGRNSARDILKEVDVKVGARDDRSKEKKISDLRRLKMDTRGGIYRYVPIQYHVYVDFFKSMYRKPKFEDVQKTTGKFAAYFNVCASCMSACIYICMCIYYSCTCLRVHLCVVKLQSAIIILNSWRRLHNFANKSLLIYTYYYIIPRSCNSSLAAFRRHCWIQCAEASQG
jgi:hypothetical protein